MDDFGAVRAMAKVHANLVSLGRFHFEDAGGLGLGLQAGSRVDFDSLAIVETDVTTQAGGRCWGWD